MSKHLTLRADGRFYTYEGADTPSARTGYDKGNDTEVVSDDHKSFFKRIQVPAEFLGGFTYLF